MTASSRAPGVLVVDDVFDRVFVDRADADIVQVAEVLVGARRKDPVFWAGVDVNDNNVADVDAVSAAARFAVAQLCATGALRFLVEQGGARARPVLRAGRKETRVWTPADVDVDVDDATFARFSELPLALCAGIAWRALPLGMRRVASGSVLAGSQELSREERRVLGRDVIGRAATAFDDVFCVVAAGALERLRLPDPITQHLTRAVIAASPLAQLFFPLDIDVDAFDADAFAVRGRVRLLELLGPGLTEAWVAATKSLWRSGERALLVRRCENLARLSRALVAVCDRLGRLDLAAPFLHWCVQIPALLPTDARERLVRLPGVVTLADRDEVVAALVRVVDIARVFDEHDAALFAIRYGDERYDEAQLWKRLVEESGYRTAQRALAACRHGLVGALG